MEYNTDINMFKFNINKPHNKLFSIIVIGIPILLIIFVAFYTKTKNISVIDTKADVKKCPEINNLVCNQDSHLQNNIINGCPSVECILNNTATFVQCKQRDVNNDMKIDIIDFAAFARIYGKNCQPQNTSLVQGSCGQQDSNNDGKIDIIDFSAFAKSYGKDCPISSSQSSSSQQSSSLTSQSSSSQQSSSSTSQTSSSSISITDTYSSSYNLKVMVVNYNPIENGVNVADKYYTQAMGNRTATQTQDYAYNSTINSFKVLSKGRINYTVVKNIDIKEFPVYPDGFQYTLATYKKCVWGDSSFDPSGCDIRKAQFDYINWTKKYNICEIAEANNVDEIWTLSPPYVMQWENFMIGPNLGFQVNGASYIVNTCHKHYIVLGGAYNSPDLLMHDIGHRVEATLTYLFGNTLKDEDYQRIWSKFARWGTPHSQTYLTCGNTHFPTNATADYQDSNMNNEESTCSDWQNFPNFKGDHVTVNCTNWECNDAGWQKYWLGSLPYKEGKASFISKKGIQISINKDWWSYILYPDYVLSIVNQN